MASVVSSTPPAPRRLIRSVRRSSTHMSALLITIATILLGVGCFWAIHRFKTLSAPRRISRTTSPSKPAFPEFRVVITDSGIGCEHSKREREFVEWDSVEEIQVIRISVNDPLWEPDLWVVFIGSKEGCSIPVGAAEFTKVFDAFERFSGFDHGGILKAQSDIPYVSWRRSKNA